MFFYRQDIHCFGDDTCYSLAFGVPAGLMLIATVILVMGKNMYVHKPPQGSVLTQVIGSIFVSFQIRILKNIKKFGFDSTPQRSGSPLLLHRLHPLRTQTDIGWM